MTHPLYDAVLFQAKVRPRAIAVQHPWGIATYAQLINDVHDLSRELAARLGPNPRMAAIAMPSLYMHVVVILALSRLGVGSASVASGVLNKAKSGYLDQIGFSHLIVSGEHDATYPGVQKIVIGYNWRSTRMSDPKTPLPVPYGQGQDVERVVFSSGTTGVPKGVAMSRSVAAMRLQDFIVWYDFSSQSRMLSLCNLYTGPGFWWTFGTLAAGGAVFFQSTGKGFSGHLLDFVDAAAITHFLMSPLSLKSFVEGPAARPLPHLCRLEAQGSHLPIELAQKAALLINPNVFFNYGATEVGAVASARISQAVLRRNGCGYVRPDAKVEIVDEHDQPVPNGTQGRVRMWSRSLVNQYLGAEQAAKFPDWFYPGDMGVLEADGLLSIAGREDDLINIGGAKISPADVEACFRDAPGIQDVAAFPVPTDDGFSQAWVAVVVEGEVDTDALLDKARKTLAKPITGLIVVDAMPRTDNEKIIRHQLAEMVRERAASTAAAKTQAKSKSLH